MNESEITNGVPLEKRTFQQPKESAQKKEKSIELLWKEYFVGKKINSKRFLGALKGASQLARNESLEEEIVSLIAADTKVVLRLIALLQACSNTGLSNQEVILHLAE